MIKLYLDNTSKIDDFHLYEPYFYKMTITNNCFLVNNFAEDNSDIKKFNITIDNAYNILLNHVGETYEVVILTELKDDNLLKKIYEIDENIIRKFNYNVVQKAKKITIMILDYTGNGYVDFSKEKYVLENENNEFFCKNELRRCQIAYFEHKDTNKFVEDLIRLKESKTINNNNKWYFNIFDKMIENFYDTKVVSYNKNDNEDIVEIFKEIMSYYIKKEIINNKLILRYNMHEDMDYRTSLEKKFIDINRLISFLSLDMNIGVINKNLKGIYDIDIELDNKKLKEMIMQYSENLKLQLQVLLCNKKMTIPVEKRVIPNISLRNIFLEPVKVNKQRLSLFKSSKDVQYLEYIEKYITNLVNKKIHKVRNNNVKNVCDLRTLRYYDDIGAKLERLNLIEIENKIQEKSKEYETKFVKNYNNKVDYYDILDEFLTLQKEHKEKILFSMNKKLALNKFLLWNVLIWLVICLVIFITYPSFELEMTNRVMLGISLGSLFGINIISTMISSAIDNSKIHKQIDSYIEMVNNYNSKLQISSDEEIEKLTKTYELILLNCDIEYYKEKYNELVNDINMQEFHICQLEKHINIAKRLCERVDVSFEDIVIDKNNEYDEIIANIDVTKDVCQNSCYHLTHFLLKTDEYEIRLNGSNINEALEIQTYIKSISLVEDEVYKF